MRQRIRNVPYESPLRFGVEVMSFRRLRALAAPGFLSMPLRPDFHSLLLVTEGEMVHRVDFEEHALGPGSVLWVKPGQVQSYVRDPIAGDLVVFRPDFLIPGTLAAAVAAERSGFVSTGGSPEARSRIEAARKALRREYGKAAGSDLPDAVLEEALRHLLSVLILALGVGSPPHADPAGELGTDARFRDLLEQDFAVARDVGHYAARLGYSPRTLARATQAAAGESPKQAIDRRVTLEARRLLAHTDRPIATVARELGFPDPSNFSAFFARHAGEPPGAFRARTQPRKRVRS